MYDKGDTAFKKEELEVLRSGVNRLEKSEKFRVKNYSGGDGSYGTLEI